MSADPRDDAPGPDPRTDGSVELAQRDAWGLLFADPMARNYVFAAFGSLAMIFLVLFERGSDLGGLLIVIVGLAGVLLRWTAAPPFVLIVLMYFLWTPTGIPGEGYEDFREIRDGRFRPSDVLLVMATLVYVACQYRIFGLVQQAVEPEGAVSRKDDPPTRRPPALIRPAELGTLFAAATGLVIAGQLVWWFANGVEVVPAEDLSLRAADPSRGRFGPRPSERPGALPPGATRFVLLAGLVFFGTLLARLVFGYWRLRAMGPAEGGMILLDAGWTETRRERARVEKWRVWGRDRAKAKAERKASSSIGDGVAAAPPGRHGGTR